jgi:hypothetical protein
VSQQIEGLPVGTKLTGFRRRDQVDSASFTLDATGCIIRVYNVDWEGSRVIPVIKPDNVYGVYDLEAVPIPEGYERAGALLKDWFRVPRPADTWLSDVGLVVGPGWDLSDDMTPRERIILRKKPAKRVLVIELPITENPEYKPWRDCNLRLDVEHLGPTLSGFAEELCRRTLFARIEERPTVPVASRSGGSGTVNMSGSSEDQIFAEALARIQAAPCFRDLDLRQQKLWAEAQVEADRFRESLRLERLRTASEVNGDRS